MKIRARSEIRNITYYEPRNFEGFIDHDIDMIRGSEPEIDTQMFNSKYSINKRTVKRIKVIQRWSISGKGHAVMFLDVESE